MKKRFLSFLLALLSFLAILPPGEASFFGPGSFAGSGFVRAGGAAEAETEFAEEEDEVTGSGTDETPVVTLPYTPPVSENDYFILWSAQLNQNNIGLNTYAPTIRLRNTTDGTLLTEQVIMPVTTSEWLPVFGIAKYTSPEVPTEKEFELSIQAVSGITSKLRKSSILIIQGGEGDQYLADDNETTETGNSTEDKVTLTFTPDEETPYLFIGYAEGANSTGTHDFRAKLNHSSTDYGGNFPQYLFSTNIYRAWGTIVKLTLPASSQTIKLQYTSAIGITHKCRRARILALNLNRFNTHYYNEDRSRTTNTDNAYTDPSKAEVTGVGKGNHIILGTSIYDVSAGVTIESGLIIDDSTDQEALIRLVTTSRRGFAFFVRKKNFANGTHTVKLDFAGDGTNTIGAQQAALAVLK